MKWRSNKTESTDNHTLSHFNFRRSVGFKHTVPDSPECVHWSLATSHTHMRICTLNMLFLGSRAAKANHGCRCEVGMHVPDPCSPSLCLCWPQTKHMPNGTLCVRGCVSVCVYVSHERLYVSGFV